MITKKEVLDNLSEVKKWIEESDKIVENKKINITIRHRYTGDIIWESEKTTYKEAVEEAIKSNANLSFAELSNANLNGTLYYMGYGNRNFEALCKAIKTIKHNDGKFDNLVK